MPAFTSGPDAATPTDNGPDPFITVPSQSNENTDPVHDHVYTLRTPLQSPTKASAPTIPQPNNKVTPLRRRFLKEVTMSPATPPQSPSSTESRAGPHQNRASPTKAKGSPTKHIGKLEIGVNGFIYTQELPESKITPKKADENSNTPWRRTPSPTKMGGTKADAASRAASPVKEMPSKRTSPAKPAPSKVAQGSPLRRMETPTRTIVRDFAIDRSGATKNEQPRKSAPAPSGTPLQEATTPKIDKDINTARTSPTKSIKLASKFAQGTSSTPTSMLSHRNKVKQNDMKEEATGGTEVASATPITTSTFRPLLNVAEKTPTRAKRGSSFNMGDMIAGLKDVASKPRGAVVERVGESDISEPPTPLQKDAEKLQPIVRFTELKSKPTGRVEEIRTNPSPITPTEPVTETRIVSPFRIKEQTVQYRSLPAPVLPNSSESFIEVGGSSPIKEYVQVKNGSGIPAVKPNRPAAPRRAVTDPAVRIPATHPEFRRKILKRMSKLEQSLSLSLGVDFKPSRGKENTFELPVMANSAQEPNSGTPASTRRNRKLLRTTSDGCNISSSTIASSVRASMFMNLRTSLTTLPVAQAKAPRWPVAGNTPHQVRRERLAAAKEEPEATPRQKNGSRTSTPMKPFPLKSISTPCYSKTPNAGVTSSACTTPLGTPGRSVATSTPVGTHATHGENGPMTSTPSQPRSAQGATTTRAKSTATPAKSKPAGGGIPQGARKSIFDPPAQTRATPALKSRSKPSGSVATRRPAQPSLACGAKPRPKFVGATDIADRVAGWNSEDRKKASTDSPEKPNPTEATPSRSKEVKESHTPAGSPTKKDDQSHTPKGSPTKLPSCSPMKSKPTRIVPPKTDTKTTIFTPKRAVPATPKVHNKRLDQVRSQAPHTPESRALDPNAYRTPSKEIESSLDRAIDAKIEEYAKSGKEFTPSGNRVKSLLEAKAKGRN